MGFWKWLWKQNRLSNLLNILKGRVSALPFSLIRYMLYVSISL